MTNGKLVTPAAEFKYEAAGGGQLGFAGAPANTLVLMSLILAQTGSLAKNQSVGIYLFYVIYS